MKRKKTEFGPLLFVYNLFAEVLGAVQDHRQWINSIRAQQLEDYVEIAAMALTYLGALALLWVGYTLWFDTDKLLTGATIVVPEDVLEARSALVYILVGAFVVPAMVFGFWFVTVWLYRLGRDVANHHLPRFVRCLYFPLALLAAALVLSAWQTTLSGLAARAWLQGETILASASKHRVAYPASTVEPGHAAPPATLEALLRARTQGTIAEPPPPLELERP